MTTPAFAAPLNLVYPPTNSKTASDKIFFLGTAPPDAQVFINDKPLERSPAGHFAPSFPLQLGDNLFTVRYKTQEIKIDVQRVSLQPLPSTGLAFADASLTPNVDLARLPGEQICFGAIAAPNASVTVKLANQTIPLTPQSQLQLPANSGALTGQNQPAAPTTGQYQGCLTLPQSGSDQDLGKPEFQLTLNGKTISQPGAGKITILSTAKVAAVTAEAGVARTGPSSDYSRLTPLPKGTRATITGMEGDYYRLDYGAWINRKETQLVTSIPPRSMIRSVSTREVPGATEVYFPLQVPVPISVQQNDRTFILTLYNTTAQTDIIRLATNPLISRLDWQQTAPGQVQYTLNLKNNQQWGYKLKYSGTSLVLSLRHPPERSHGESLSGIKILIDPGHGGQESGASGPTGDLEKDVNLSVAKLVRDRLVKMGATVIMTREEDKEVSLGDRVKIIDTTEPAISISIHHNSLPDEGDAQHTQGFASFWYNTQAHSLANFIHDYVIKKLNRPDYGVFWDNLALTRPTSAPSILLELGFMSNPEEFEKVMNPQEQKKIAGAIADGINEWFKKVK